MARRPGADQRPAARVRARARHEGLGGVRGDLRRGRCPRAAVGDPGSRGARALRLQDLGRFHATHHISANHSIEIDGDTARSRSYVLAMHVVDLDDQSSQWLGGGWYDNEYRRTADGWRTRVRITPVWDIGARPPAEGDHA